MNYWKIALISLVLYSCSNKEPQLKVEQLFDVANNSGISISSRLHAISEIEEINSWERNDSIKTSNSLRIGNRYWNVGKKEKFKEISLKIVTSESDANFIGKANLNLSEYYFDKKKWDSAYYFSKNAERNFKKEKRYLELAQSIIVCGQSQYNMGQLFLAEKSGVKCLKLVDQTENSDDERYKAYNLLGNVYMDYGNYDTALEYHYKALNLNNFGKFKSPFFLKESTIFNLGLVFQLQQKYKVSSTYLNIIIDDQNVRKNNPGLFAAAVNSVEYNKIVTGVIKSPESLMLALSINDSLKIAYRAAANCHNIARFHLTRKDTINADFYFQEALSRCEKDNYSPQTHDILRDYLNIVPNRNRIDVLYSSLLSSAVKKEVLVRDRFAKIEYETQLVISEKDDALKAQKKITYVAIFIFITLLLLVKIIDQQRKNNKMQLSNQTSIANAKMFQLIISQEQEISEVKKLERKWIGRELHDNIMNRLSAIRLNLFFLLRDGMDEEDSRYYIGEIQEVEKDIRKLAHQLAKNDSTKFENFKQNLVELFEEKKRIFGADISLSADMINWEFVEDKVKVHFYNILLEVLENFGRHSKGTELRCSICKTEKEIIVEVRDNGIGFDIKQHFDGLGIYNIKDRVEEMNGTINFESSKGHGLFIQIIV